MTELTNNERRRDRILEAKSRIDRGDIPECLHQIGILLSDSDYSFHDFAETVEKHFKRKYACASAPT